LLGGLGILAIVMEVQTTKPTNTTVERPTPTEIHPLPPISSIGVSATPPPRLRLKMAIKTGPVMMTTTTAETINRACVNGRILFAIKPSA
jgi:hypothetical protein